MSILLPLAQDCDNLDVFICFEGRGEVPLGARRTKSHHSRLELLYISTIDVHGNRITTPHNLNRQLITSKALYVKPLSAES